MNTQEIIHLNSVYNARNYKPLDVVLSTGEGVWLYDVEGNRYLDMLSAYSALNQGHRHPKIVRAMREQLDRLTLTSRAFHNDQLAIFAKELCELCEMSMMLPMNTGAEAVETAIKAVRKWGYLLKGVPENQANIIVCEGNFHGRTTTIVSFSTEPQYKSGFGPLTPGFTPIPYGDIDALKDAITDATVGFLVEPIQGEAGVVIPPDGYLKAAFEICREHNVLLIVDEIQTGLGRTGRLFAYQHDFEGPPDVLILGKALGGGLYPVSAVVSSVAILGVFSPGDHGSTFGGNPMACAVARAALQVIRDDELVTRAATLGEYFISKLRELRLPVVEVVRGRGLLIGVVIKPGGHTARYYCEKLRDVGILCKETHNTIVRFAPPLVITKEEIDWALQKIQHVMG